MKNYTCDRCGNSIEVKQPEQPFHLTAFRDNDYTARNTVIDLCEDCHQDYINFIDNERSLNKK
jgi:hypothetical protein